MARRVLLLAAVTLAASAVCCIGALGAPSVAAADPPACPVAPPDSASTDESVVVLTHLRQDVAASCEVAHADAAQAHGDSESLSNVVAAQSGQPVSGTVALSDADRAQLDQDVQAVRYDLWFGFGLLLMGVVLASMWRIFTPGKRG